MSIYLYLCYFLILFLPGNHTIIQQQSHWEFVDVLPSLAMSTQSQISSTFSLQPACVVDKGKCGGVGYEKKVHNW